MSSMDRQFIEAHAVIERYLQGKLQPEEQEAFEKAYLGDPELLQQLELAEKLQQGMADLNAQGPVLAPQPWLRHYAVAASVLLAVSVAFSVTLYRDNLSLQDSRSLVAGTSITRLPLISVRSGNSGVNVLTAPSDSELVVLLVDSGFEPYTDFRATVSREVPAPAGTIWELSGLAPGFDDQLALGISGSLLIPGEYEVLVEGRMVGGDFAEVNRLALTVEMGD